MTTLESPSITTPTYLNGAPAWFQQAQSDAWERYLALPTPNRTNETWRFSNLKQLDFSEFDPAAFADSADIDLRIDGLEHSSAQFIFANDSLVYAEADLPDGVICLPLEDALQQHPELVKTYFMKGENKLGSAKYAALHLANLSCGLFIYVPKGIEIERPIEIYHVIAGDQLAIYPHTLIVTEECAKVTVVDYFKSADNSKGFSIAVNDLIAGPGSKLNYACIQDLNLDSKMIQINHTEVGRDAHAKSFSLNLGCSWLRSEYDSTLNAAGAHSDMLSISIPSGEQQFDQRTFQNHAAPHTYSDLLYKNTLYDKAKTIFSGLISVAPGAHYTDAYQTCRNLLMHDSTEANSMPGLQINADQVKCSHGSTSAAISDEEIFYLQARGIHADSARQLIARGFSIEVLERLENEELEALILSYIDQKFTTLRLA